MAGVGWGCGQNIEISLCCSFPLALFPSSVVGSSHELQSLRKKSAPTWAPLHRLPFLSGKSPPAWALHGPHFPQGISIFSTWLLHGLLVDICPTVISSTGCRGISALSPEEPPPLLPSLTLLFSLLFLLLFPPPLCPAFFALSLRSYYRGAPSIADWPSLGQWWVHFGGSWNWLFPTQGQSLVSSHRGDPCSLPAAKTFLCKPNTAAFYSNTIYLCVSTSIFVLIAILLQS